MTAAEILAMAPGIRAGECVLGSYTTVDGHRCVAVIDTPREDALPLNMRQPPDGPAI